MSEKIEIEIKETDGVEEVETTAEVVSDSAVEIADQASEQAAEIIETATELAEVISDKKSDEMREVDFTLAMLREHVDRRIDDVIDQLNRIDAAITSLAIVTAESDSSDDIVDAATDIAEVAVDVAESTVNAVDDELSNEPENRQRRKRRFI